MNNSIYKKGLAVVLIIAIITMAALGIKLSGKEKEIIFSEYSDRGMEEEQRIENKKENNYIYVDVDGAVIIPGVYALIEGSRVIDAINLAGGLKEEAITQNINKARKLVDGEKIYIYMEGDEETENLGSGNLTNNLININNASADLLMSLPGIGKVYAERIIDYRNNKRFSSIEEIKNIAGIGDKTFEKLQELITVN